MVEWFVLNMCMGKGYLVSGQCPIVEAFSVNIIYRQSPQLYFKAGPDADVYIPGVTDGQFIVLQLQTSATSVDTGIRLTPIEGTSLGNCCAHLTMCNKQ